MKSQMRQADKSGATWCLILGESELREGRVQCKHMGTGDQTALPLDDPQTIHDHIMQQERA